MEVKIKKLNENAVIPRYAHPTDAGLDIVAVSKSYGQSYHDTTVIINQLRQYKSNED